MNPVEILNALRELTARERIEFLPLAPEAKPFSKYPPINKYLHDLKAGAKPESAAEGLLNAVFKDVLGFEPTPQVGLREGFVDFILPDGSGGIVPLELKPLFKFDGKDGSWWRSDANPNNHVAQVRKYLRDNEYVILTDLRTAWFFGVRDFYSGEKPFNQVPLADFLILCRETRSVLDAVRRLEDTAEKPELEKEFFDDLQKWFNEFDKVKWTPPELKDESIILLINKLIFARTIEDFGLVPFRYTQDAYTKHTRDWQAKGPHKIVPKFLNEFEEFFDEYYDTEIFSTKILPRLDAENGNLQRFCDKLNLILGINPWDDAFKRGIVHYNYRRIDEDIFGKSYEMFLAANRKGEGIYYTPAGITRPMADALVQSLAGNLVDEICDAVGSQKCDFKKADALMAQLFEIRVADTACGSGGFLIKALRAFWEQYQRIDAASAWVQKILKPDNGEMFLAEMPPNVEAALAFRRRWNYENRRILIAQVLLRHIFGVDKDPGALEVAKTNIWKEAVKLSPADYNYRLLKTDVVKILPNLELNFLCADSLVDVELETQVKWLAEYHRAELKKLSELRAKYIANPMLHEALDEALELRKKVRAGFIEHFQGENLPCEPGGFALQFWPCWFEPDGKAKVGQASRLPNERDSASRKDGNESAPPVPARAGETPALLYAGFDGIIGNPPWEGFKPIRKEFAAGFYRGKPQFSKMGMDGPTFETWFDEELKKNAEFAARWHEHEARYERFKGYFGKAYHRQGTGDWNLFKLFIERDLSLVRNGGQFSLLVPSSIQTDEGCADLRRWFITENRLDELTSFENRGYTVIEGGREKTKQIFPDVDSRFKFGFFKVVKGAATPKDHAFDARFYLHDPKDFSTTPIRYAVEMIHRFSPHNESFMEFRSPDDYALATKIRDRNSLLEDFGYTFRRELHMTGDSHFFRKLGDKKVGKNQLRLFEGKMIHQFDANFSPANFAVEEDAVREELLRKDIFRLAQFVRDEKLEKLDGKKVPSDREKLEGFLRDIFKKNKFKLQYEFDRFAYREVARSTDERTIIGAIIPKGTVMAHTLMYLAPYEYELDSKRNLQQRVLPAEDVVSLLTLANSLVLNFFIRSKVSAHVSAFQFLELPAPKLSAAQKKKLAEFATKLMVGSSRCDDRTAQRAVPTAERAALEVFIARELYGLSLDDWKHLTGTFTFGSGETKAELDEIIRQSLAAWSK